MLEPTYVLGFLGAAITVATVLGGGRSPAGAFISGGGPWGSPAPAPGGRPPGPAARAGHRHGHAA